MRNKTRNFEFQKFKLGHKKNDNFIPKTHPNLAAGRGGSAGGGCGCSGKGAVTGAPPKALKSSCLASFFEVELVTESNGAFLGVISLLSPSPIRSPKKLHKKSTTISLHSPIISQNNNQNNN
jgi:hypothetical protein